MFLSSSHPAINKSPQSIKSQGDEGNSSRPVSSLLEEDFNDHYEGGDESDSYNDSLQIEHNPYYPSKDYYHHSHRSLSASLPDLPKNIQDNRKKKRRKKRPESDKTLLVPKSKSKSKSLSSMVATGSKPNVPGSAKAWSSKAPLIPPLGAHCDLARSIGQRRGICGSTNEQSYLDVTMFMLFYFTDIFDEWIFNEGNAKGFPTPKGKAVRSVLQKEIVYSLRMGYLCPKEKMTKLLLTLGTTLDNSESSFVEIGNFLQIFLEKVLNLSESIHYTTGRSELIHVLKEATEVKTLTTVEQLFEYSLKFSKKDEMKLLSLPQPALILTLQNLSKNEVPKTPHRVIIPNLKLDISNVLIQISDDSDATHQDLDLTDKKLYLKQNVNQGSSICRCLRNACRIVFNYLENLVTAFPEIYVPNGYDTSIDDSWVSNISNANVNGNPKNVKLPCSSNSTFKYLPTWTLNDVEDINEETESESNVVNKKVFLDLMAVVCLSKERKYTVFVKCGQNPRRGWAPWVYFDPLDKGFPVVRKVEDFGKWLNRLEKKPEKIKNHWKNIPQDIQKLLTESTLFIYHTKPNYESQNTLFSFANEK